MKTSWYYRNAALAGKLLLVTALLTLASCKEEDPELSTQDLLIGSWELVEAESGDFSIGGDEVRLVVKFHRDGDYSETVTVDGGSDTVYGEWELSGSNEIELEYDDGERWELEIISINKDELEVEDDDGFQALFERDN